MRLKHLHGKKPSPGFGDRVCCSDFDEPFSWERIQTTHFLFLSFDLSMNKIDDRAGV